MKTAIEMAKEAGIDEWWDSGSEWRETLDSHLERLVELARADEREACLHAAEVAVSLLSDPIAAIRARTGEQK